jgi:hypothetical protein
MSWRIKARSMTSWRVWGSSRCLAGTGFQLAAHCLGHPHPRPLPKGEGAKRLEVRAAERLSPGRRQARWDVRAANDALMGPVGGVEQHRAGRIRRPVCLRPARAEFRAFSPNPSSAEQSPLGRPPRSGSPFLGDFFWRSKRSYCPARGTSGHSSRSELSPRRGDNNGVRTTHARQSPPCMPSSKKPENS